MKVIISGGGTGGHIFPAISIANALKNKYADVEILFVGAKGKMEMQKVPQAAHPFHSCLPEDLFPFWACMMRKP